MRAIGSTRSTKRRFLSTFVSLDEKESPGPARKPKSISNPRYPAFPIRRSIPKTRKESPMSAATLIWSSVERNAGSMFVSMWISRVYSVRAETLPRLSPRPGNAAAPSCTNRPRGSACCAFAGWALIKLSTKNIARSPTRLPGPNQRLDATWRRLPFNFRESLSNKRNKAGSGA